MLNSGWPVNRLFEFNANLGTRDCILTYAYLILFCKSCVGGFLRLKRDWDGECVWGSRIKRFR